DEPAPQRRPPGFRRVDHAGRLWAALAPSQLRLPGSDDVTKTEIEVLIEEGDGGPINDLELERHEEAREALAALEARDIARREISRELRDLLLAQSAAAAVAPERVRKPRVLPRPLPQF